MRIGICSYSFHRQLADGRQDIFQFIKDSKALGCTQLDPWCGHLAPLRDGDHIIHAGNNPDAAKLEAGEDEYIEKVKAAGEASGLPFGIIAVDGAHIYHEDPEQRHKQRQLAYRWIDIGSRLGTEYVRIDAGGPPDMPDDVFAIIKEGYEDLVQYARDRNVKLLMENHFGPSLNPDHVVKIIESIDGLDLLFDSNNWMKERQVEGWERCARYAKASHIKTFTFDDEGNEPSVDLAYAIKLLQDNGFDGCWGVESVPKDGNELAAAEKTIALIKRHVA